MGSCTSQVLTKLNYHYWASLGKTKFKMQKSFYQVSSHSLAGWLTHRGSAIW